MRKLIVPIVALALAGGVAACGDDESGDSGSGDSTAQDETGGSDDFATQAEAACVGGAEAIREINLELGYARADDDMIEYLEQLLEARQSVVTDLEALEPPADARRRLRRVPGGAPEPRRRDRRRHRRQRGWRPGCGRRRSDAGDRGSRQKRWRQIGAELGIDACAGVVPEDDAEAAEEVLLEYSTTTDPAVICEPGGIATEIFVEGGFGGVDPCLDEQQKLASEPSSLPDDIEVTKVSGVDDVVATIEYEEVGGSAEGDP